MNQLVVDTNILITFFWENSTFSQILKENKFELFSPEYALTELKKHEEEIIKKANITKNLFDKKREEFLEYIEFISLEMYSGEFKIIQQILKDYRKNEEEQLIEDIDFLALALKLNCPLWSHDKLLKKQEKIIILTTKDIIELI